MRLKPNDRWAHLGLLAIAGLGLASCGTTYAVPEISTQSESAARTMFAQETAKGLGGTQVSDPVAAARFELVISRIEPVAENFCRSQMAARPDYNCDVRIVVDTEMPVSNAYQTRARDGSPVIAFTVPMLREARNDDEIAFVLSHEYGHLIGTHLEKADQQAAAGALILGALVAASQGYANANDPYRNTANDTRDLTEAMATGAAIGNRAYSQTYELESDVIATYITRAAGYDPVNGAKYFARPEKPQGRDGNLSFWGTHPANDTRLALVIETNAGLDARKAAAAAE